MEVPKKCVLIVSPTDSVFAQPYGRAFESSGYECAYFYSRRGIIYSNANIRRLIRRFPLLRFLKKMNIWSTNRELTRIANAYRPEIMLSIKAEDILPETVREIGKSGIITCIFFNDLIDHWEHIKTVAPIYDYFFNQCNVVLRRIRDELGLTNAYYMAHATEPYPRDVLSTKRTHDVAFIGTYDQSLYPNREPYLREIRDLGLQIWGTESWVGTSLKDNFNGRSFGNQRFDIYAHSKIVIDINWDIMPAEGLSNRPFEVTGCGAMFMTDYVREDIRRAYVEGKEVVLFKNERDLREKVKYYLEHEEERAQIAAAGYHRTVADHTYVHRVKELLDVIAYQQTHGH